MTSRFVLVQSPLVGPCTWQAAATELRERQVDVVAPSLAGVCQGPGPYYEGAALHLVAQVEPGPPVVLVAHSGAGSLLPAIADALAGRGIETSGAIFVDAVLPHPGRTWFDTVPVQRGEQLRERAVDGQLPPWNEWFGDDVIQQLVPDHAQRQQFLREVPVLPLAYFEEAAPDPATWPPKALVYVRLSAAYQAEEALAEMLGWPKIRADLDHLAMLTRPAEVADLILESAMLLGSTPSDDGEGSLSVRA